MKKWMWIIGTLTICTAMVAFAGCTNDKDGESSSSAATTTKTTTTTTGAMTTTSTTAMPTTDGSMTMESGTTGATVR